MLINMVLKAIQNSNTTLVKVNRVTVRLLNKGYIDSNTTLVKVNPILRAVENLNL